MLRRRHFFHGVATSNGDKDVFWLRPDGREMTDDDWRNAKNRVLGMWLPAHAADEVDDRGRPVRADSLLLLLNAGDRAVRFALPGTEADGGWRELVSSASPSTRMQRKGALTLAAHGVVLLARQRAGREARSVDAAEPARLPRSTQLPGTAS